VHVRTKTRDGREDEDYGVVTIGNLKGDAAANMIMKAITKAKRRVTLSISGLGMLDETEIETIPGQAVERVALTPPKGPPPAPKRITQAEPDDPFRDPAGYITHLEEEMIVAGDATTLDEVWSAHLAASDGRLPREQQHQAEGLYRKYSKQVARRKPQAELPMAGG
jgi:hypothetical protein